MPLLIVPNKDLLSKASNLTDLFEKRQSEFVWLLLLNDRKPDLVLHDLHIEFNSNFYIAVPSIRGRLNLLEAYRVGKGYPLIMKKYCTWRASKQFICGNETIIMRRKDLMGYNMTVGIITRTCKEVLRATASSVYGSSSLSVADRYSFEGNELFGNRLVNGTWEGLLGQLVKGHLDVGLALIMVTPERQSAVDFSLPLTFSRLILFLEEPKEEELTWDNFLRPFDRRLWLCTITVVPIIWAVLRIQRRYNRGLGCHDGYNQTYSDILHVAGIFLMKGCGGDSDTKWRDSVRTSLLVASMSAMVIYTAYCGTLTASLATHRLKMPFTDLQGLLRDGSYKLLLLYASGEMALFANASDAVLSSVYEKHVEKEKIPVGNKELFDRLCSPHKNAAMITDVVYRGYKRRAKCPTLSTQEHINIQAAIALRKRSPYRELINYHLLEMRSEGLIHRIYWKYWMLRDGQEMRESLKPVTIQRVVPALAVLVAMALLSLCFLLLERKFCNRPVLSDAATSTD
ncbi:probable glutamate receptor [Schistocerca cancellata]|uniref:probable glutamate receptor n=1 Tax=Schistocerca cancellata TaxID=274614 RepID=UPI0021194733|nr:probable glutamate receptor [Schistocerca cancellata]